MRHIRCECVFNGVVFSKEYNVLIRIDVTKDDVYILE